MGPVDDTVININQAPGLVSLESAQHGSSDRLPFASPTLQLLQQEKELGIKDHNKKSWKTAEKHFSHALELASDSYPEQLPSLYSALGLVHFHLENYQQAIVFCTCSIKRSVQHWPAYICRSFAYSCLKNLT